MNFLSRHSKAYQSAIIIHPYMRFFMSGVILVSITLTWWFGLYAWSRNKVRAIKSEIVVLQKKQTDIVTTQKTIKDLEQEVELLRQQIDDYRPGSLAQAQQEQMVTILNAIGNAGMGLNGYEIQPYKEKGWYLSQIVQTELVGTYEQCIKFLSGLKECEKMIQCDQLRCTFGKSGDCIITAHIKMTVPLRTVSENKQTE